MGLSVSSHRPGGQSGRHDAEQNSRFSRCHRFFKQALDTVGHKSERVTTDGLDAYPRAIRRTLGRKVEHRTNCYLNNRVEQDYRAIKQRYYPMRGFRAFDSAARFCSAFDEVRQYFRPHSSSQKALPLPEQRRQFKQRFNALFTAFQAA